MKMKVMALLMASLCILSACEGQEKEVEYFIVKETITSADHNGNRTITAYTNNKGELLSYNSSFTSKKFALPKANNTYLSDNTLINFTGNLRPDRNLCFINLSSGSNHSFNKLYYNGASGLTLSDPGRNKKEDTLEEQLRNLQKEIKLLIKKLEEAFTESLKKQTQNDYLINS
ncbi:hypothetical protein [Gynurincola endophyticus]|uniref:hypothetical protein n=1 Tax=Gynurincola endophyticus TaxID=2479004 RepID=UPI000F8CB088|nr:hypothetical protein [Gynurincola endophyticus]